MSLTMVRGFFDDERIRILRRYGDRYVMIFMMLVGISERDLPDSGLYLQNGKSILKDDLPAILGVDIDTAKKAFMLLESLGMLEIDDGVIYVNYSGLFYENSKAAV